MMLKPTKAHLLLCFLAAQPHRMISRNELATLLWDESPDGRHVLRTTLTRLRQYLPFWPLRIMGDTVGWDPDAPCQTDTQLFRSWSGSLAVDAADSSAQLQRARAAVLLWRGEFLEGYAGESEAFDEWLFQERLDWERQVLRTLGWLITAEYQSGDWHELLAHCRQAIQIAPYDERFYRYLMRTYSQLGEPAEALAWYKTLTRRLKRELGSIPESETTRLRDQIAVTIRPVELLAAAAHGAAQDAQALGEAAVVQRRSVAWSLLDEDEWAVLASVAIFEQGAPPDALCQVAGTTEAKLKEAVHWLTAAGWIREKAADGKQGRTRLWFVAEEARAQCYAEIGAIQRRRLHRRALAHFAGLVPGETDPLSLVNPETNQVNDLAIQLVHHAAQAELWPEAAYWCRVVATAAERLGYIALASTYLERAITCLERLPLSQSRVSE